jgi:uncharacterized protein (DUF488 family)
VEDTEFADGGGEAACAAPSGWWDSSDTPTLYTIGHSNRPLDELLSILSAHRVRCLVDVRRFPGSRKNPHFGKDTLPTALEEAGIGYLWLEDLGGRRSVDPGSDRNAAWRVQAFRAYANYMATEPFSAALEELEATARQTPTAIMCAEALWTRCHRRLIADALVVRGWNVLHLMSPSRSETHRLPDFAVVNDGNLSYPPPPDLYGP